ncbi:hypothetical protein ABW286_22920 [Erwinia papayae]|uniref:Uncharacterized protein n=1 Tax=Erwinia papayae TaxID=206499 RepID=A0ABV3N882_9GAMM
MKISVAFLFSVFFSISTMAGEQSEIELISCSLQGDVSRKISFYMNRETQKINYFFNKGGENELQVLFDKKNMLKRTTDRKMDVTYYGFNRGKYSYILNIINGKEVNEYSMSFLIKKGKKIIQSDDCLNSSYKASDITSKYIEDVPFNSVSSEFQFP